MTDLESYERFLMGVNKEETHVVSPKYFNLIINGALIEWAEIKAIDPDFVQSRIDDLSELLVVSELIDVSDERNTFAKPQNYFRGSRCNFILYLKNSPCGDDGETDLLPGVLLKSDRVSVVMNSFYLKPNDSDRVYYRSIGKNIIAKTGIDSKLSESVATKMEIEYYKYPEEIEFIKGQAKELELGKKQILEVIAYAVTDFLRNNGNSKYEANLREKIMKNRI